MGQEASGDSCSHYVPRCHNGCVGPFPSFVAWQHDSLSEACGILAIVFQTKQILLQRDTPLVVIEHTPEWTHLQQQLNAAGIALYVVSSITNVSMSGLIAFRIWKATKGIGNRKSRYLRVAWLVLETGVLYSICLVLSAIMDGLQGRNTASGPVVLGYAVLLTMSLQLIGIFPTVIILLVALRKTSDQTIVLSEKADHNASRGGQVSTIQFASPPGRNTSDASGGTHTSIELEAMHVTFDSSKRVDMLPKEEP
ncbi:hypothetical protein NEOLEDRAFT_449081 [Neolentinus lepideus HHB14362 ss-1]|uniref:Uncharacterized protein n=1 Tax=Neolentinus lepideus HHB14362 ss-1 TaxID=1314782 RepID=A0A165RT68_9AGAM|nr:hypothetical protein NEOLEDRAFT_449081 [Neolentinus lepideus HHB14362 ss-1]